MDVLLTKLSWRGPYQRRLLLSGTTLSTLDPADGRLTNSWHSSDVLDVDQEDNVLTVKLAGCFTVCALPFQRLRLALPSQIDASALRSSLLAFAAAPTSVAAESDVAVSAMSTTNGVVREAAPQDAEPSGEWLRRAALDEPEPLAELHVLDEQHVAVDLRGALLTLSRTHVEAAPPEELLRPIEARRDSQEAVEVGQMARAEVAARGFAAPTIHEGVRDASSEVLSSEEDKAQGHYWLARRSSREVEEALAPFRGTGAVRAAASRLSGSG